MSRAVVVMGRRPAPGKVKTRLAATVGDAVAAELYDAFLRDVFDLVGTVDVADRVFSCALFGDETVADLADLLPARGWRAVGQGGDALGDRIESARAAGRAAQVVVIGSDAPTMPSARFEQAFRALDDGAEAVFGPVDDGGYDLIGLSGPHPELLTGIDWSTPRVMTQTRAAAAAAGVRIAELDLGYDIDDIDDLARAYATLEARSRAGAPVLAERTHRVAKPALRAAGRLG